VKTLFVTGTLKLPTCYVRLADISQTTQTSITVFNTAIGCNR